MTRAARPSTRCPYVELELEGSTADGVEALGEAFERHGALLARNAPVDVGWFRTVTDALGHSFIRHPSDNRPQVGQVETIQHVDFGTRAIPLHAERSQTLLRPTVCWFYCVQPPKVGGETQVCDGAAVVESLRADLRAELENRSLRYRKVIGIDRIQALLGGVSVEQALEAIARPPLADTFTLTGDVEVAQDSIMPLFDDSSGTPAFANYLLYARRVNDDRSYPTFEDFEPIPDEICDELGEVADSLAAHVEWRAGDLLILDNRRFMHGRSEVVDPTQRVIYSRFGHRRSEAPLATASTPVAMPSKSLPKQ